MKNIPRNDQPCTHVFHQQFELNGGPNTTIYTIQPNKPFRLRGFLVWDPVGYIESIKVGNVEQITMPIPLAIFNSPWSIQEAKDIITRNGNILLEKFGPFSTCKPTELITLTIHGSGSISHIIFWGIRA